MKSLINLVDCLTDEFHDESQLEQVSERETSSWLEVLFVYRYMLTRVDRSCLFHYSRGYVVCIYLTRIPVTKVQMSLKNDDALSSLPFNGSELFPKHVKCHVFNPSPFPQKCTREC